MSPALTVTVLAFGLAAATSAAARALASATLDGVGVAAGRSVGLVAGMLLAFAVPAREPRVDSVMMGRAAVAMAPLTVVRRGGVGAMIADLTLCGFTFCTLQVESVRSQGNESLWVALGVDVPVAVLLSRGQHRDANVTSVNIQEESSGCKPK